MSSRMLSRIVSLRFLNFHHVFFTKRNQETLLVLNLSSQSRDKKQKQTTQNSLTSASSNIAPFKNIIQPKRKSNGRKHRHKLFSLNYNRFNEVKIVITIKVFILLVHKTNQHQCKREKFANARKTKQRNVPSPPQPLAVAIATRFYIRHFLSLVVFFALQPHKNLRPCFLP